MFGRHNVNEGNRGRLLQFADQETASLRPLLLSYIFPNDESRTLRLDLEVQTGRVYNLRVLAWQPWIAGYPSARPYRAFDVVAGTTVVQVGSVPPVAPAVTGL